MKIKTTTQDIKRSINRINSLKTGRPWRSGITPYGFVQSHGGMVYPSQAVQDVIGVMAMFNESSLRTKEFETVKEILGDNPRVSEISTLYGAINERFIEKSGLVTSYASRIVCEVFFKNFLMLRESGLIRSSILSGGRFETYARSLGSLSVSEAEKVIHRARGSKGRNFKLSDDVTVTLKRRKAKKGPKTKSKGAILSTEKNSKSNVENVELFDGFQDVKKRLEGVFPGFKKMSDAEISAQLAGIGAKSVLSKLDEFAMGFKT